MIKLIKNLTKKDYIYALISFILIIIQVWLELKMPDFMSKVTVLTQSDGSKMSEILLNGLYMMLCAFGSLISTIIVGYLVANISASFSLITRKKLFEKVELDVDVKVDLDCTNFPSKELNMLQTIYDVSVDEISDYILKNVINEEVIRSAVAAYVKAQLK